MSTTPLEIGYHTNLQSRHVLTFHTLLGKVPRGASSCRSRFLLLSPASLQHHPSLFNNLNLYNFISSLDQQGATHIEYVLHCQKLTKYVGMANTSTCDISWESPSVMTSFTECNDCAPRSIGRASWNNQWKKQHLSFGAMHVTTTVTFPFKSFTESITSQRSAFIACLVSAINTCNFGKSVIQASAFW